MKKLLGILVLGLLLTSNSYSSDTDGRWRGLVSCEWNPFYKLNNGGFEGIVDLTIKNDNDDATKKIIEAEKWMYPSWSNKGGVKIKSYKISKKKLKLHLKNQKKNIIQKSGSEN